MCSLSRPGAPKIDVKDILPVVEDRSASVPDSAMLKEADPTEKKLVKLRKKLKKIEEVEGQAC